MNNIIYSFNAQNIDIENNLIEYPLLDIENNSEFDNISSLQEFNDDNFKNDFYIQQKILPRYISPYTPYNNILLFHYMGTGKTYTVLNIVSNLLEEKTIQRIYVLTKNSNIMFNFLKEMVLTFDKKNFKDVTIEDFESQEYFMKIKKKVNQNYSFHTFEKFIRYISNKSKNEITNEFSHSAFIVDEVHNIRDKEDGIKVFNYEKYHELFHYLKNIKIILLSGSPMYDSPKEFADIMNLILPMEKQILTGENFLNEYYNDDDTLNENNVINLMEKVKGYISYLKGPIINVKKENVGEVIKPLTHIKLYKCHMSSFQSSQYKLHTKKNEEARSFWMSSRRSSLFVFPDGNYKNDSFQKYINNKSFLKEVSVLKGLQKYSCKFYETVKLILENDYKKFFIYCEFVTGGGCILLGEILKLYGYYPYIPGEKRKSFILLTNETITSKQMSNYLSVFNDEKNIYGEYIQIIIGSKLVSEGYTFKDLSFEIILNPFWNYSQISQIVSRGWRAGSHDILLKKNKTTTLKIYFLIAMNDFNNDIENNIDLKMYFISENKDKKIKLLEHFIKKYSWDCNIFYHRNLSSLKNSENYSRECEYNICKYECIHTNEIEKNNINYNILYYSFKEVLDFLTRHFKYYNVIHIKQIQEHFYEMNEIQLENIIFHLIHKEKIWFKDKFLQTKWLQKYKCYLFLSNQYDYFNYYNFLYCDGDIYKNKYYKLKNYIQTNLYNKKWAILKDVFNNTNYLLFRKNIELFNEMTQSIILQSAILYLIINKRKDKYNVDFILNYYKGFYVNIKKHWFVWLYNYNLPSFHLEENIKIWKKFNENDNKIYKNYKLERQKYLSNSPIGFYGSFNSKNDNFCLIEINEDNKNIDGRKIKSGKRCLDWDLKILIDIIVRRIKKDPPIDASLPNEKKIRTSIQKSKFLLKTDNLNDIDFLKRLYYWSNISRINICDSIYFWLNENDYIISDINCGTQLKKKLIN
jgi:hypothetical protein